MSPKGQQEARAPQQIAKPITSSTRAASREQHSDGERLCGFEVDDHHNLKRFKSGYKS
jgi:hypothetical protein